MRVTKRFEPLSGKLRRLPDTGTRRLSHWLPRFSQQALSDAG